MKNTFDKYMIWISNVICRGFATSYIVDFQRHTLWISNIIYRGFLTSYVEDFQLQIWWIFNVIGRGFPTSYVQRRSSWIPSSYVEDFQRHMSLNSNVIHRGFSTSCIVDFQSYVADFQRHTDWSIHLNYICSYSIRHVINLSVTCDEKRITVYILVLYFIANCLYKNKLTYYDIPFSHAWFD